MGLYLGKQRIIAINEKIATKQWVTDQGYLKNANLSDFITNEQLQPVSDKIDDVSAKVEDISTKIIKKGTLGTINGKSIENGNNITIDLSLGGYYTKEQTDEKFLTKTEVGNLADYVKNGELDTKVGEAGYVKNEALTSYAKKTDIPSVPTKLSELTNDSSFITTYTETDPVWTSEKVNYYTKTEIDNKNYLTEHQSLADYVKTEALTTALTTYAKKTELPTKLSDLINDSGFITTYTETDPVWTSEKVNYYTKTEVDGKNYLTNSDLNAYVTIFELNTVSDTVDLVSAKVDDISTKISEKVATKQWVTDQHYLTEHQSLADYATKTYVTEQIGSINSVLENI